MLVVEESKSFNYYSDFINQFFIWLMNDSKNIWLDCDPGHDDMLAIIMAALSDRSRLIGISTSAGNSFI